MLKDFFICVIFLLLSFFFYDFGFLYRGFSIGYRDLLFYFLILILEKFCKNIGFVLFALEKSNKVFAVHKDYEQIQYDKDNSTNYVAVYKSHNALEDTGQA